MSGNQASSSFTVAGGAASPQRWFSQFLGHKRPFKKRPFEFDDIMKRQFVFLSPLVMKLFFRHIISYGRVIYRNRSAGKIYRNISDALGRLRIRP